MPDEVSQYTEVVVSGHAEKLWPQILRDYQDGCMGSFYKESAPTLADTRVDRTIFEGKKYLPMNLIECGRGCPFHCDFCDIPIYFNGRYYVRPMNALIAEIEKSEKKVFVVVDDNLGSNPAALRAFCEAVKPLHIKWVSQTSITIAKNESLLDLMADSGCMGMLIGFESIDPVNLGQMNKQFNQRVSFETAIQQFHQRGIRIHGSFIVGYDHDTAGSVDQLVKFAVEQKLYIANFNPLTPIPRTPLYKRLQEQGRLTNERWWLDYNFRYGDFVFRPAMMSAIEMSEVCEEAKKKFYSLSSILKRSWSSANINSFTSALTYLGINLLTKKEVVTKGKAFLGIDGNLDSLTS